MRKLTKLIGVALIATGMMASFTGCTGLYNQIDELEKELAEEKAKNEKLTEENKVLEAKKAELEEAITVLNAQISQDKKTADALMEEIKALKEAAENNELTAEQKQEYNDKIAKLEADKKELIDKITKAETDLATARENIEALEKQIDSLKNEVNGLPVKVYKGDSWESANDWTEKLSHLFPDYSTEENLRQDYIKKLIGKTTDGKFVFVDDPTNKKYAVQDIRLENGCLEILIS